MKSRGGRWAVAAASALMLAARAVGSGGPPPVPDYVTAYAASPVDRAALAAGRLGIMKGSAPSALLYLDWRLLHRLNTGAAATEALATPCCGTAEDKSFGWIEARRTVPGASTDLYYLSTERSGPNYASIPNCFGDAFNTATLTLKDRIARYGAGSSGVRAWLAAQDAVFEACSKSGVTLPSLSADAPDWLRADHAYQAAALALYDGRLEEAGRAFAAIGRDRASPWQPMALYLQARTLQRAVLNQPDADGFARAHAAIARLAAAPAGTYGQGEIERMKQVLDYHEHPAALLARLDTDLNSATPPSDIAVKFKDYASLTAQAPRKPEAADWIATIQSKDRAAGLAHAHALWQATHDSAWLVAALSLAMPGDEYAAVLAHDASLVPATDPAWLTAQYHQARLTIASAPAEETRACIDKILARTDLTPSDQNIFLAVRMQLATTQADFVTHALRQPYCNLGGGNCANYLSWPAGDGLLGRRGKTYVGLGGDARAVIDRLPLKQRLALGRDPALPREFRLDITLTNYSRAVLLQDNGAIDETVRALIDLLPQVRSDWQTIVATRSDADKRFAEIFVMAKIPSLRTDLADYSRPQGNETSFGGYWVDWQMAPAGGEIAAVPFRPAKAYSAEGDWSPDNNGDDNADLVCAGQCGKGIFVFRLAPFAATLIPAALRERAHFLTGASRSPATARSLWDEAFTYVNAHPNDPRAPETLYRLIRVARWGGNHDHLGKRAFQLLHTRYPRSTWTKRSPYYYD